MSFFPPLPSCVWEEVYWSLILEGVGDRYGTGNMSFGNFDFDPVFYPTPAEFIANLSAFGFDFQVIYIEHP